MSAVTITFPYSINQTVMIKALRQEATVRQLCIAERDAIQLEVTWFANGTRQGAWLRLDEVEEITEVTARPVVGFAGKHGNGSISG